jgi:hypothetical protein
MNIFKPLPKKRQFKEVRTHYRYFYSQSQCGFKYEFNLARTFEFLIENHTLELY